jgi:hypothetical protein
MLVIVRREVWFGLRPSSWSKTNGDEIDNFREELPWRQGEQVSLRRTIEQNMKRADQMQWTETTLTIAS